jgi:PAS domain S-box-containing protein
MDDVAPALLDAMPDVALLVGAGGSIAYVNSRVEQLLGWLPTELIGQSVETLVPPSAAGHHASLRQRFADDPRSRPMGSGLELDAVCRDKSTIAVEISLSPLVVDGNRFVIAVVRDGRPQRAMREALAEVGDHVRSVIDSLQDGVLEFDIQAERYTMVNPRFCEMVGLTEREVLATTDVPPWWNPDQISVIEELRRKACDGAVVRYELGLRHRDGRCFTALVTTNTIRRGGRWRLIGLFHDLTEERRAADQLVKSRAQIALLEDRDRIGRDLHDGVIQRLFAAGLHLQASLGRADQKERVVQVIDEIDDAIKQIRAAIFPLHSRRGLATDLEHGLRVAMAEASRLLPAEPELRIVGDVSSISDDLGEELLTVVRELLSNVAKHAQASATSVELSIDDGAVRITVEDNGVGLDEALFTAGSGLKNLRERAAQRHGQFHLEAAAPSGTKAIWQARL